MKNKYHIIRSWVVAFILFGGLFTSTVIAQSNNKKGDKRENTNRQNKPQDETPRVTGRNTERTIEVNRNNSPGRTDRNPTIENDRNNQRDNTIRVDMNANSNRNRDRIKNDREGNDNRTIRPDRNSDNDNRNPGNYNNNNNRDNTNFGDRNNNGNRNNYATINRPGYRPDYGHNRHPVYNQYNPGWRYNYLPCRNSYYYSLPSSYFNISFGGIGYRYWDGVYYRPYNNLFTVVAPPIGLYINVLPLGHRRIMVRNYPYYYYNGTYYDQRGSNYFVVSPPLGAVVESLPLGYETLVVNGETFYTIDGAQYKPFIQQNGEIWYEVIKSN